MKKTFLLLFTFILVEVSFGASLDLSPGKVVKE